MSHITCWSDHELWTNYQITDNRKEVNSITCGYLGCWIGPIIKYNRDTGEYVILQEEQKFIKASGVPNHD